MSVAKSALVFLGLFVFSSVAIYFYIGRQNNMILKAQDTAPRIIRVDEINPSAFNNLKKILRSKTDIPDSGIEDMLRDLTRQKSIELHPRKTEVPLFSFLPFFVILSSFFTLAIYVLNLRNPSGKNDIPLFMTSLNTIEYPVLLVNSELKIVWQNQKSSMLNYGSLKLEEIFDESFDGSEVAIDLKKYSVLVTELNLKKTKHYLAHLVPVTVILKNHVGQEEHITDVFNVI